MKIFKFTLTTFALIAATSLSAQQDFAGEGIVVKGQLADSITGETIPFATLSIAFSFNPETPIARLVCDENGVFRASLGIAASYIFTIQSLGKAPLVRTFDIEEKKTVDLGLIFLKDLEHSLGEVTVTAQKPLVKVEVDRITYNLEDDPEARTATMLEMLRKVPMVTVDGEDRIEVRGADNFKIYLNGKPTNMLSGSNVANVLRSMPASSVKNIEVITDPGAKYEAEGTGGIINIITARNAMQGYSATVNAEAGSMGGYRGGAFFTTKVDKLGLTANYNYNHGKRPWGNYESEREQYGSFANTLTQSGRNRNNSDFHFGSLEANYELDSLNLIRLGANLYGGKSWSRQELHAAMEPQLASAMPYSYDLFSSSENNYISKEINLDFQRSTRTKDELMTFSYRYANDPDDSKNEIYLENAINYYNSRMYPLRSENDAFTEEHTGQIDYTRPTWKNHSLETGVKYILRQSRSDISEFIFDNATELWNPYVRPTDRFAHHQDVLSGYFAYSLRHNSFSAKAGVRAESTSLDAKYAEDESMNFSTSYFDAVPSASLSFMMGMASQLRAGYNMRIYRPGIWFLNPYVNNTDPQNISYGNPALESEKSHSFNINYNFFTSKINFNANLSYRFVNNSIERYTFVNKETGVNESTYENMGKNENLNLFLFGRWSPSAFFNMSLNLSAIYSNIESSARKMSNDGITWLGNGNVQLILPKEFSINTILTYVTPGVQLQTKSSPYLMHGITLNKTFLNRKLTVTLVAQSPLTENIRLRSTVEDPDFRTVSSTYYPMREIRLRVSYRFGTLKGSIRQLRRGISNDDAKSGSESSAGGVEQNR